MLNQAGDSGLPLGNPSIGYWCFKLVLPCLCPVAGEIFPVSGGAVQPGIEGSNYSRMTVHTPGSIPVY